MVRPPSGPSDQARNRPPLRGGVISGDFGVYTAGEIDSLDQKLKEDLTRRWKGTRFFCPTHVGVSQSVHAVFESGTRF